MPLDHERLDVYRHSLDFMDFSHRIAVALPRGVRTVADQLLRAALSIVLNIAEGAGRVSRPDKRKFFAIARGSAMEAGALLDVCHRLGFVTGDEHGRGKAMLERLVAMLSRLLPIEER